MSCYFGFDPIDSNDYYFISYNSSDAKRVGKIVREMYFLGIPLWYDRGLIPGEEWEKQIAEKIRNCSEVIIFITKKLMKRKDSYVRKEYSLAVYNNKPIHFVYLDNIRFDKCSVSQKNWFAEIEFVKKICVYKCNGIIDIINKMDNKIRFTKNPNLIKEKKKKIIIKNHMSIKKRLEVSVLLIVVLGLLAFSIIKLNQYIISIDHKVLYDSVEDYYHNFDETSSIDAFSESLGMVNKTDLAITGLRNNQLTELRIPHEVDGKSFKRIAGGAFKNNTSITSVILPPSIVDIGSNAFYNCTSLKSIKIDEEVTGIGSDAFYHCESLSTIKLPESMQYIGNRTFANCISLKSINLPDNIEDIGKGAFMNCISLKQINIPEKVIKLVY